MKQNQISKNAPLLVGMIIDVSSSMRRNWKNEDGEQLPQIEVIKDGLNRQIRKIKSVYSSKRTKQELKIFCLGMGFKHQQRAMRFVDLSDSKEMSLDETVETVIDAEVVCDILALTEIIPTKADLDEVDRIINSKWSEYSDELLARVVFREGLYDDLITFIREGLRQTALKKLRSGFSSRILALLVNRKILLDNAWINDYRERLSQRLKSKEERIRKISVEKSFSYVEIIKREASDIFSNSVNEYERYIRSTLNDFVLMQTNQILELLTLGHSPVKVFDTFDEKKVFSLAENIYTYLEDDVRPKIKFTWLSNRTKINIVGKTIGGKINNAEVKNMTEAVIQKVIWEKLRRFVRITVNDMFEGAFRERAKEKFYEWVDLASSREVTRSIKDIANVLPDALEQEIYSDKFMFGVTPIYNAIKKASLRFMDVNFSQYQKILLIISDGEFTEGALPEATNLLKDSGVTIINLHISNLGFK